MEHADGDTLIRDELGLCLGETRVDVAVINGRLEGYEIKSARDRLDRLEQQAELYGRVLDVAVLVAAERHVERALPRLPVWWGVWCASADADGVRLSEVRSAGTNPGTDRFSVAQLLWREEALEELQARGAARGLARATRWRLWEALADSLSAEDLGSVVRRRLRARQGW